MHTVVGVKSGEASVAMLKLRSRGIVGGGVYSANFTGINEEGKGKTQKRHLITSHDCPSGRFQAVFVFLFFFFSHARSG